MKLTLLVDHFDRFIGSTLICAAQNIGMLVVGRVINGIAVGIESSQVPVYISELDISVNWIYQ